MCIFSRPPFICGSTNATEELIKCVGRPLPWLWVGYTRSDRKPLSTNCHRWDGLVPVIDTFTSIGEKQDQPISLTEKTTRHLDSFSERNRFTITPIIPLSSDISFLLVVTKFYGCNSWHMVSCTWVKIYLRSKCRQWNHHLLRDNRLSLLCSGASQDCAGYWWQRGPCTL